MIGRMTHLGKIGCLTFVFLSSITLQIHAQRDSSEAESWLRWSLERREAYVGGYVEGYYGGYLQGCQEGTRSLSKPVQTDFANFPVNKCIDRKLDFTKGFYLAKDVTRFFKRYPENRDLLIKEILEELGKGRTLDEIHNHPPFPAMTSATRHLGRGREN